MPYIGVKARGVLATSLCFALICCSSVRQVPLGTKTDIAIGDSVRIIDADLTITVTASEKNSCSIQTRTGSESPSGNSIAMYESIKILAIPIRLVGGSPHKFCTIEFGARHFG